MLNDRKRAEICEIRDPFALVSKQRSCLMSPNFHGSSKGDGSVEPGNAGIRTQTRFATVQSKARKIAS
jgi:hypothetical protein